MQRRFYHHHHHHDHNQPDDCHHHQQPNIFTCRVTVRCFFFIAMISLSIYSILASFLFRVFNVAHRMLQIAIISIFFDSNFFVRPIFGFVSFGDDYITQQRKHFRMTNFLFRQFQFCLFVHKCQTIIIELNWIILLIRKLK